MSGMEGLAILVVGTILYGTLMAIVWSFVAPYIRWNNYLQSYRIGKLVKHAAETETKFVFAKPVSKSELEEIDAAFDKAVKVPKEITEIESAYSAKA